MINGLAQFPPIGLVVIGRNEGERLRNCLRSCSDKIADIVYVDSGSTDGSVETARQFGVDVVELDSRRPFSAARARNEGYQRLISINSKIELVQFLDGDCELFGNWLKDAAMSLLSNPKAAIVCGRLRERYPEKSLYNRICDIEWSCPPGEVEACGGIFMIRASVFDEAGGFDAGIIAGEEPELCFRIRRMGWKVLRLEQNMAWHDAAMMCFRQWWKRAERGGHGYAEGMARYGHLSERYNVKNSVSIWVWAMIFPLLVFLSLLPTNGLSLLLLLVYPYKICRTASAASHLTERAGDRWVFALFCFLAKWPQLIGQIKYWLNYLRGKKTRIFEYKNSIALDASANIKKTNCVE